MLTASSARGAARLFVCSTPEVVATRAAASIVAALQQALRFEAHPQIVFSAGASPVRTYHLLRTRYRNALAWERLRLVQMDEYVGLPADDCRLFNHFLRRALVEPLGLQATYLTGRENDADMAAYEARLLEGGGIACVFHGVGINGHLGFNEPGSSFHGPSRRVSLAPSTSSRVAGPVRPHEGVTLGLGVLNGARRVRLIAVGESKAAAVRAGFFAEADAQWPISSLQRHAHVQAFVDMRACPPPAADRHNESAHSPVANRSHEPTRQLEPRILPPKTRFAVLVEPVS